jgi:hypothetical protein
MLHSDDDNGHPMTARDTTRPRLDRPEARDLDRQRRLFLLARAQLTANGAEPPRRDAERRQWRPHRRRFS